MRIKAHRLRIYYLRHDPPYLVLVSSDLGYLLGRCSEVALREGERTRVVPADMVIHWRALQVATATPHLPGIQRLLAQFPGMHASANGLLVPLRLLSPEEVLARCAVEGVRVTGSRVVYASPREATEGSVDRLSAPVSSPTASSSTALA